MDKNGFSSEPKSVCERIFKAVAKGTSLRTIRRVSDRPEDANPVSAARNASPENTKAAEVVPLKMDRSVSIESNGGAVLLAPKSSEKSKSATPLENQSQVTKTAPNTEPAPITASGKEDKPKPGYRVEISQSQPTKVNAEQNHGQREKLTSKIENGKNHVSMQEEKPKHKAKVENINDKPVQGKEEEGKKIGMENINDEFTDYINRAKLKMRATSDVGTTTGKTPPPRADSFNKKVTDYIDRAKFKIRTTSGIGGWKSKSFKQKE